jgi:hypothetical protein
MTAKEAKESILEIQVNAALAGKLEEIENFRPWWKFWG